MHVKCQKVDFGQKKGTLTSSHNSNFGIFIHFEALQRGTLDNLPNSDEKRRGSGVGLFKLSDTFGEMFNKAQGLGLRY